MRISDEVLAALEAQISDPERRGEFIHAYTTGIVHALESLEAERALEGFDVDAWLSQTHGRVAHLRERGGL